MLLHVPCSSQHRRTQPQGPCTLYRCQVEPLCKPLLFLHIALQARGTAKQPVRSLTKVGEDVFVDAVETASAAASVASDLGQSKPISCLPAQLRALSLSLLDSLPPAVVAVHDVHLVDGFSA